MNKTDKLNPTSILFQGILEAYLPYNLDICVSLNNMPDYDTKLSITYTTDKTGVYPILFPWSDIFDNSKNHLVNIAKIYYPEYENWHYFKKRNSSLAYAMVSLGVSESGTEDQISLFISENNKVFASINKNEQIDRVELYDGVFMLYCLQNHIDYFNLIPRKLAISKYDIKD